MKSKIKIGTRGSKLALYQAELVKAKILEDFPSLEVEISIIKTSGDMIRRRSASPLETKRIFTREIEEALIRGEVDLAVHSAKDLSVFLTEGTVLGAVLEREDPRDCVVSRGQMPLVQMPQGSKIGTSSLRRKQQLMRLYPSLVVEDVSGNVDTRVKKVLDGQLDGIILAHAGLKRIGLTNHVSEVLDEKQFYPSPGQGAIVVQTRKSDSELNQMIRVIHHISSGIRLECERAFLRRLEGGCQLPCGVATKIEGAKIQASGILLGLEANQFIEHSIVGETAGPELVGKELAEAILEKGGQEILESIRKGNDQ